MTQDIDRIEDMEREDTKNKIPIGWLLLFSGLIIWGIIYILAYTPEISGWSQEGQYLESIKR
jgi:hypothetical protein